MHNFINSYLLIVNISLNSIEDLIGVVISYEFYQTCLGRVSSISHKITMSVSFCLSYDPLKMGFYRL